MFLEENTGLGRVGYASSPRLRRKHSGLGCAGVSCVECSEVSCANVGLGAEGTDYGSMFTGLTGKASDWVVAEIQSKVGDFLGMKKRLLGMKGASDAETRQEAEKLYADQVELEGELGRKTPVIDAIKDGKAGWTEAAGLAGFAYKLNTHMDDVNALDDTYMKTPGAKGPSKGFKIGGYQLSTFQTIGLAFFVARFALGLRRR